MLLILATSHIVINMRKAKINKLTIQDNVTLVSEIWPNRIMRKLIPASIPAPTSKPIMTTQMPDNLPLLTKPNTAIKPKIPAVSSTQRV